MRFARVVFCASILTWATFAQAKDNVVEARSAIESVIVHPDAATVTRKAKIDLPAGATTVLFKNLPFALDPTSLRVAGSAQGRSSIGAVEARVAPSQAKSADSAAEALLKELRAARDAAQVTIDALSAKQAMIVNFSQSGPEKATPDGERLALGEWNAAFDTIGAALSKTGEELRIAKAKAKELDDAIRALETGNGRPGAQGVSREAAISVELDAPGAMEVTLTYLVGSAGWRPEYDARLDTGGDGGKPRLEFVRRASVTQRTGEDWTDVALSVSTARAHRGASAPEVHPQRVGFFEPPVPLARSSAVQPERADGARKRSSEAPAMLLPSPQEAPPPAPAEQQVAALDATAFQATFRIAGASRAPSDGSSKSFVLSSRRTEPSLVIRAAPALDATAYLGARFVNEEDAPLAPGVVAVQRDGVHVGSSRIGFVAPGEAVDLGFGPDDKVKVARVPVKRLENEPSWFGQTKFETRDFKTTVKNLHDFLIRATIVDQVPFSENTAIVVETLPQTTPPTEKEVADKRGVMAWSFEARPGETKEIRLAYRVKWPADRDIVTQPAPLAPR